MVIKASVNGAYAVVLTSSNDYVKGVKAIKHAIHNLYKSQYPLLILYTPAVMHEIVDELGQIGCIVKQIEPIRPKGKVNYTFERFIQTWTKLAVWNESGYDRLVLMDADMLPLQNMDELMHLELPDENWVAAAHACVCNPQKISHYPPTWIPENCAYSNLDTSACDKGTPLNKKTHYFNSGLIVLTPNVDKFNYMLKYLNGISDLSIYPFPDQDFLNEIFQEKWIPISYVYNALKTLQRTHSPMWDINRVKNVHYILTKPWDIDLGQDLTELESVYKPLYEMWWHSFSKTQGHIISLSASGSETTTPSISKASI